MTRRDHRLEAPAYRNLARDLREEILRGEYRGGRRLPTEAELVERYGVGRQTVRRAFQDLVAEDLVHRVRGRGTFAVEPSERYVRQLGSIEDLMNLSMDTTLEVTSPLERRIDVDAAGRLGLTADAVWSVSFLRRHEGVSFCTTTVSLPPRVADLLCDVEQLGTVGAIDTTTIIGLLDTRLDAPIAEADQSVTAVASSPRTAASLGVDSGAPLLRIDRLYSTADGTPVELAVSHFRPDVYSYRVRLRRTARES